MQKEWQFWKRPSHSMHGPAQICKISNIEDILWSGVQEAMTGKYSAKETLLLMEKQVREVLK
jgi:hypothetical protein